VNARHPERSRGGLGFSPLRLVLVTVMLVLGAFAIYVTQQLRSMDQRCEENLASIFGALNRYENEWGRLPELAFFPDHPEESRDSLLSVLRRYGVTDLHCVCPALPQNVQRLGITYVWNSSLSGRARASLAEPTWMLVEISALNPQLAAPHANRYHVLYSDGTVRKEPHPPGGL
jgi:hypothetical protein